LLPRVFGSQSLCGKRRNEYLNPVATRHLTAPRTACVLVEGSPETHTISAFAETLLGIIILSRAITSTPCPFRTARQIEFAHRRCYTLGEVPKEVNESGSPRNKHRCGRKNLLRHSPNAQGTTCFSTYSKYFVLENDTACTFHSRNMPAFFADTTLSFSQDHEAMREDAWAHYC
jgi:hypothetical protein